MCLILHKCSMRVIDKVFEEHKTGTLKIKTLKN